MQERNTKIRIGITGPDLLLERGGAQNHALMVMAFLSKKYDISYLPNPFLIDKYRRNIDVAIKRINYLRNLNIIIPPYFTDGLNAGISQNLLLKKYEQNLEVDFLFNFNQDFPILSADFTRILSTTKGIESGVCFQNPCIGNISPLKYLGDSIRLSLIGKNYHSLLFRIYQYVRTVRVMRGTTGNSNLRLVLILNSECQQKIKNAFAGTNILFPANGIMNPDKRYDDSLGDVPKKNKIIFFARCSYSKGIFDLIPIFKGILKIADTKLVVVGKFDHDFERDMFLKRVNDSNLKGKLVYMDYLKDEDFYREIAESKVMLYPSHSDTYPIGVLQSLYFRTPVVAYNTPAMGVFKKLEAVRLVKEFDVVSFADETVKILSNNNISRLFTPDVLEFISLHSWEKVSDSYSLFIDQALAPR